MGTEDFGYKHLLWVYSGRRGIHLWISDKEAMDLTDDQRRAIVQYIEVVKVRPRHKLREPSSMRNREAKNKRKRSMFGFRRLGRLAPAHCTLHLKER
jgi:DNA primase catalytic subunit